MINNRSTLSGSVTNEAEANNNEGRSTTGNSQGVSSHSTFRGLAALSFWSESNMNLPYFKFMVQDWLAGSIQACSMETQGIYINVIARMWKEKGRLSTAQAPLSKLLRIDESRLEDALSELAALDIICKDENGCWRIKFVDEQFEELTQDHTAKSVAGKKGGKKRAENALKQNSSTAQAPLKQSESESESESDTESETKNKTQEDIIIETLLSSFSLGFKALWEEWRKDRKERRLTMTSRAEKMQLNKCVAWGEQRATNAINASIENAWRGLYEQKTDKANTPSRFVQGG